MAKLNSGYSGAGSSRWFAVLTLGCLLVILLGLAWPRLRRTSSGPNATTTAERNMVAHVGRGLLPGGHAGAGETAQEIVAGKVALFAEGRLRIARSMAERFKLTVAPDVERFFRLVAAGRWEELTC